MCGGVGRWLQGGWQPGVPRAARRYAMACSLQVALALHPLAQPSLWGLRAWPDGLHPAAGVPAAGHVLRIDGHAPLQLVERQQAACGAGASCDAGAAMKLCKSSCASASSGGCCLVGGFAGGGPHVLWLPALSCTPLLKHEPKQIPITDGVYCNKC